MLVTRIFHLMMSPDRWLEVAAEDVVTAIVAGRNALPHLHPTEEERAAALLVADDIRYTLTCLLCGTVNPPHQGYALLVAMQEHLMEQHGVIPEQLRTTIRVFTGTSWEGQYVWSFPPQTHHTAPQPYFRASRYTTAARAYRHEEHVRTFTPGDIPSEARTRGEIRLMRPKPVLGDTQASSHIALEGEDASAWYGYSCNGAASGAFWVWPKQEWRLSTHSKIDENATYLDLLNQEEDLYD